ncbi:MAG: hypothetical protein MK179_21005, partial [Pirellulaceae bacterium]|nr:hypothetical protein [Pirellulaceae bacterium]
MDVVRSSISLFFIVFFGFTTNAAAENDGDGEVFQWKLSEEVAGNALRQNPVLGHSSFPGEWHFLRTTRSDGPIETRKWL